MNLHKLMSKTVNRKLLLYQVITFESLAWANIIGSNKLPTAALLRSLPD